MENAPLIKKIQEHPMIAIFLFFQFLFIIMLIFTFARNNQQTKIDDQAEVNYFNVNITNLESKIPNIDRDSKESIISMLSNIIKHNTEHANTNIEAKVKDEHFIHKKFNTAGLDYYNFIIDVPSIKHEYQVKLDLFEKGIVSPDDSTVLNCIEDETKMTYKDFTCKNFAKSLSKYDILNQYFNYVNFGDYNVYPSQDNPKQIDVYMASTDKTSQQIKQTIVKWIRSMGYSPEGYKFNFSYEPDGDDESGNE